MASVNQTEANMHYLQPATPAPTITFPVGPYLVTPRPLGLGDTNNTCYHISRDGRACGAQVSYPDLAQCRDRERETIARQQVASAPKKPRFNNLRLIRCRTCYLEKPHTAFHKRIGSRNARLPDCKQCVDLGIVQPQRGGL